MNIFNGKPIRLLTTLFSMLVSIAMLNACGGSSGGGSDTTAGIGGTGIVYGKITGFGSVFVIGERFNIDTSQIIVDGVGGKSQSDLKLGMIVQLEVETENGVYTGDAIELVYDDEIEGPLTNIQTPDPSLKTGNVFGQTINFSDTTTIFENTSFENLGNEGIPGPGDPDVVEISGFRVSDTEINATYVRYDDDFLPGVTEVELRGPIKMLVGSPPSETFQVDGIDITTNSSTVRNVPGGVPAPDLYVEVEGVIQADSSVIASEYEFEDEDFDDDVDDISMQGVVSGFAAGGISNFFIDSQHVDASNVQPVPVLMDGINIEVEGEIVAGTLIADEVEIRDGDSKLRSFVDNVVNTPTDKTFEVVYSAVPGSVTVHVDNNTLFEDETGPLVTSPFSLDDLRNGSLDFVRVEGVEIANNEVLATFVRRTSPDDELKLEGQVDGYAQNTFITILGVTYGLDFGTTTYDPLGAESIIAPGDFVEIEDERIGGVNPPGIADEVEHEN